MDKDTEKRILLEMLLQEPAQEVAPSPVPAPETPAYPPMADWDYAHASIEKINGWIPILDANRQNPARRPFPPQGALRRLAKRFVRKLISWYIEPLAAQQTVFNDALTPTLGNMRELHAIELSALESLEQQARQILIEQQQRALWAAQQQAGLDSLTARQDMLSAQIGQNEQALQAQLAQQQSLVEQQLTQQQSLMEQRMCEQLALVEQRMYEQQAHLEESLRRQEAMLRRLEEMGAGMENPALGDDATLSTLSQSGEDRILHHVLQALHIPDEACTYLDLGANHAKYLSNTYYFYSRGARGVLVEANPALIPELRIFRSGDIILNRCVSLQSGEQVDFYVLNGDGLSTPVLSEAEQVLKANENLAISQIVKVETVSVQDIIAAYFPQKVPVLLNVDIEGMEEEILASWDFEACRPLAVILEMIPYRNGLVVGAKKENMVEFMAQRGYREYAFTGINSIFLDNRQLEGRIP